MTATMDKTVPRQALSGSLALEVLSSIDFAWKSKTSRGFRYARLPGGVGAIVAAGVVAVVLSSQGASAQNAGCRLQPQADPPPPRQVLTCNDGLVITAEPDAVLSLTGNGRDDQPHGAKLDGKAILIEDPPSKGGFQIRTPHAIAVVRGTVWAVDVTRDQTSVFVERGKVAVRRPGGRPVTLGAGDGVDVRPGDEPLIVNRWSAERVATLFARFGR